MFIKQFKLFSILGIFYRLQVDNHASITPLSICGHCVGDDHCSAAGRLDTPLPMGFI
jgi:hypothetical protein